jgi:hypothetical protein
LHEVERHRLIALTRQGRPVRNRAPPNLQSSEEARRLAVNPMDFGHAEKKPTAVLADDEITSAEYNGFSQIFPEFRGRHAQC